MAPQTFTAEAETLTVTHHGHILWLLVGYHSAQPVKMHSTNSTDRGITHSPLESTVAPCTLW